MKTLLSILGASMLALTAWVPNTAFAQGAECGSGLCGTPNQSGGGCGCGCGSVLVAMTDRGDTYQFADDFDGDGIEDEFDNCAFTANYEQSDSDGDMTGDACDVCVNVADPLQADMDADGFGDFCDEDIDGDNVLNGADNCPSAPNAAQVDSESPTPDGVGDACDTDDDDDGILDIDDPCRLIPGTTVGLGCDDDADGDGIEGARDLCPNISNPELNPDGSQLDIDGDQIGDACDLDMDGDGVDNHLDNCMKVANPGQIDADFDGLGDAGTWTNGSESCDNTECYVIAGDYQNCLNPQNPFMVYLTLVGERLDGKFQTGSDVTIALFSNRLGQIHNWTARFDKLPDDSDASLVNAKDAGATTLDNPQVSNCLRMEAGECTEVNNVRFTPDAPGKYKVKLTVSLPNGDPLGGPTTASYTIVAEVGGEAKGGCAATSAGGMAALALALLFIGRRRSR